MTDKTETVPFATVAALIIAQNVIKVFPDLDTLSVSEIATVSKLIEEWANGLRISFQLAVPVENIVFMAVNMLRSESWRAALALEADMRAYIQNRSGR